MPIHSLSLKALLEDHERLKESRERREREKQEKEFKKLAALHVSGSPLSIIVIEPIPAPSCPCYVC